MGLIRSLSKRKLRARTIFRIHANRLILSLTLLLGPGLLGSGVGKAAPVEVNLNRALEIGWYSLRVQNLYGTNYTGIVSIKSFNKDTNEFLFADKKGQDILLQSQDISTIYFRQLPDRSDVNVNTGGVRNIQIFPYKQFLYDIPPGRLMIQDGILTLDTRWRAAQQTPFGVTIVTPTPDQGTVEQVEITRSIQVNYLGNRYLVETELVNMVTRPTPDPSGGRVPRRLPTLFPNPAPAVSP
jgi:hypothetical protein